MRWWLDKTLYISYSCNIFKAFRFHEINVQTNCRGSQYFRKRAKFATTSYIRLCISVKSIVSNHVLKLEFTLEKSQLFNPLAVQCVIFYTMSESECFKLKSDKGWRSRKARRALGKGHFYFSLFWAVKKGIALKG